MQSLIASSRPGPRLRAAVGGVNLPAADPASLDLVTREPIFHRNRQIGSRRAMSCHCAAIGHEDTMPEVIINGPEGRIAGRYLPAQESNAPIALMLHPDRKSVVEGKSVPVRVDLGGRRIHKKKNNIKTAL